MNVREKSFTVKQIVEGTNSNNIIYDHPIQRLPGQWDNEQKSLFIHSLAVPYAVPQVYGLQLFDNYDDAFTILDGKQRFTTVCEYINDEFSIAKNMPPVFIRKRQTITDENGNRHAEFISQEYDISDKKFSELDEKLQERIMGFQFSVVLLSDCTDDDIENQFLRLNNGAPLTSDQKTRARLGEELAAFLDEQEKKELFTSKVNFNKNQRVQGVVQTCILQSVMLIMDYPYKDLGNKSMMEFADWFRTNHKKSDLEYCADIFDKLNEALPAGKKPHTLMKKTNIPILAFHVQTADEVGLTMKEYGECIQELFDNYIPNEGYANYCGSGSYTKEKVKARLDYVEQLVCERRKINAEGI